MVYRIYVEKKEGHRNEANSLLNDVKTFLMIDNLKSVRILNRYDVENIEKELFDYSISTVFSEPQTDDTYFNIDNEKGIIFAVEYLPGQFDQRADSASQCIQIISQKERPIVKTAKVYILEGNLSDEEINQIKKYVINPVESREASLETKETLVVKYDIPTSVKTLDGFNYLNREGLNSFIKEYSLAMDIDDVTFCQEYFKKENRNPTLTEIRMIDT